MNSDKDSDTQVVDSGSANAEPLPSVVEVLGWKTPEALDDSSVGEEETYTPKSAYEQWKMTGSPEDLYNVTKSLSSTINASLASMGGSGSPNLEARARVIAAKAVQSYDPEAGASLATWVSSQLRQMVRDIRKSNSPLHVPDGVKLDAYAIYRAETEFMDEHGREPTMDELADAAKMPIRRIQQVRKKMRPVTNGKTVDQETGETSDAAVSVHETDYSQDAMDYVYSDADRLDKKIMEMWMGYNGYPQKDNKYIMDKLKLTPVQLSRRKTGISMRMFDIINDLESVQNG